MAIGLVLAPTFGGPAPAAQAADCFFQLGFKTLHDMIPDTVGECTDDESHNPDNGDGLQPTTRGLLVWRKADNWTAFTDGSTTWLNGPDGLVSRPNSGPFFPWEKPTPAPAPAPAPQPQPQPQPQPAPAPQQANGPIQKQPAEIILGIGDLGKEIDQVYTRNGSDDRGGWQEVRFQRAEELINAGYGPLKIVNRVYIANNVSAAQAIYKDEVNNQTKFPEAQDARGTIYVNDGSNPKNTVTKVGDEMDSRAACNETCNTENFNRLHQRTVMRYQNVVTMLYFWGSDGSASTKQVDEWIGKLRERIS